MYSLITKTQEKWGDRVSSELNKLNTWYLFETDNKYGFPVVKSSEDFSAKDLVPFHMCKKLKQEDLSKGVHFFLDDYKFEQVWTRPKDFIHTFKTYGNIITPNFSVWSNQPYALNLFNVYRSRWCTRYYQEFGVNVLIDVKWSDESSYEYAFSGIEKYSPVIVNTVGTRNIENRKMFVKGFYEMLRVIEPEKLYVYGEYMPIDFNKYFEGVIYYQSFWQKQRDRINSRKENK